MREGSARTYPIVHAHKRRRINLKPLDLRQHHVQQYQNLLAVPAKDDLDPILVGSDAVEEAGERRVVRRVRERFLDELREDLGFDGGGGGKVGERTGGVWLRISWRWSGMGGEVTDERRSK